MKQLQHLATLHDRIMRTIFHNKISKIPGYKYLPTTANATLREFREQWREFNLQLLQKYTTTDEVPEIPGIFYESVRASLSRPKLYLTETEVYP